MGSVVSSRPPLVALITGASGFIGAHLAARLINDGWEAHALLLPNASMPRRVPLERVIRHEHDGTTEEMVRIVSHVRPTVVFHLASLFLSEHKTAEVEPLVRSNVLLGAQLLDAMSVAGVSKLVNTGTAWQHYENRPCNPVNLYAATKQAFEAIVDYYVEAKLIAATTLKLIDTYGPYDERGKLLALLKRCSKADTLMQMSPGEQPIDLVHVDDVVAAFAIAANRIIGEAEGTHAHYSVSSGHPVSVKELVSLIEGILGRRLPIAWGARPYRRRELMVLPSLLPAVPGWSPCVSLADGLKREFSEERTTP